MSAPKPRLGHRAYGERFTNVDLVFLLFDPFMSLAHPGTWVELTEERRKYFDAAWRPGVEW